MAPRRDDERRGRLPEHLQAEADRRRDWLRSQARPEDQERWSPDAARATRGPRSKKSL